jgi:hypothetical protein
LKDRFKLFMKHLERAGLLVDFSCAAGEAVKGVDFLLRIDKHVTTTLRKRGWIFPPKSCPADKADINFTHMSWKLVFYQQKKIDIPRGALEVDRLYKYVADLKTPVQEFGPKTLRESPFGAAASRPEHPFIRKKVLVLMGKHHFKDPKE